MTQWKFKFIIERSNTNNDLDLDLDLDARHVPKDIVNKYIEIKEKKQQLYNSLFYTLLNYRDSFNLALELDYRGKSLNTCLQSSIIMAMFAINFQYLFFKLTSRICFSILCIITFIFIVDSQCLKHFSVFWANINLIGRLGRSTFMFDQVLREKYSI